MSLPHMFLLMCFCFLFQSGFVYNTSENKDLRKNTYQLRKSYKYKPAGNPRENTKENTNHYKTYPANWEALDSRPLPAWYDSVKIGVMITWGVYSVPSVYSDWFWYNWKTEMRQEYVDFMKKNYRPGFTYADFAPMLSAEFLNTTEWVDLLSNIGASYVVFTAKHHEGFANWPSNHSFNWNSRDIGPNRDIVGELVMSLRNQDMRVGLYYSLYEWFHPLYLQDKANNFTTQNYVAHKVMPELYDLVNTYKPDILWSDGDWEATSAYWNSTEFIAWLYNDSPVKDDVVTNDRWGSDAVCKHGGFLTCEDSFNPDKLQAKKWENAMSIDKTSRGYRRKANLNEFLSIEELISTLVQTVSCGGNILINVAPSYDGTLQPLFQERLVQLGQWMSVNAESIYSSFPWKFQNDTVTPHVWYTQTKISMERPVYAIALKWPTNKNLYLAAPIASEATLINLMGTEYNLNFTSPDKGGINITIPDIPMNEMPCKWAWVFTMWNLKNQ